MKEKLGILTFHTANNFGAILQGYALKNLCEEYGFDVYFIRYSGHDVPKHNKPLKNFLSSTNKKSGMFVFARSMMSYLGDRKKENKFIEFRDKYMCETTLCETTDDICNLNFDAYISGSDQIWNYKITGGDFDKAYFLDFDSGARKIIYAASSQDVPFPRDMEKKFVQILTHTNAIISIREQSLAQYSTSLTNIKYPVVLDPTLLAGREIMDQIATRRLVDEPYILIYQIDANPYSDISVKTLEAQFKMKVFTLTVPRIGSVHGRKGDIGPEDFLSYLKYANVLVTNSFHGVALSVIYEKQFYVYENGGVMSRIDDLLERLHIYDRKVCMAEDIDLDKKIDYKMVNQYLLKERNSSKQFLVASLKGEYQYIPNQVCVMKNQEMGNPVGQKRKEECCGCSACANVCPVQAIMMVRDSEGFLYPKIDLNKCIKCGRCDKVCSFHSVHSSNKQYAYGAKHKDFDIRDNSRSGGVFVAVSDWILQQKGVVYGSVMDSQFAVKHMRAENATDRDKMTKAKYVQSEIGNVFFQVGQDLINRRNVLFSGTPCQVAGLYGYLDCRQIDQSKLITCDLICHGVPSPMVWRDYIHYVESKAGKRIIEAQFRDKDLGWEAHCESFKLEGKKQKAFAREYTDLFYQHIMFRPSCGVCPFASMNRPGDLTLGDFWGIEKHDSSFNDNRGVSLVLINTEKGEKVFDLVKDKLENFECDPMDCMQPTLQKPSMPSPRRSNFWKDYGNMNFEDLIQKYVVPNETMSRYKYKVKHTLYHLGIRKHP